MENKAHFVEDDTNARMKINKPRSFKEKLIEELRIAEAVARAKEKQ